jgi:mannose-6-phosphate isomerase-like protein (cupin superfamily)
MNIFELKQLLDTRGRTQRPYLEFLRVPALSAGLYVLPAGGVDPQQPHTEDEVYYLASGRGVIEVAGESRAVAAGNVIFVKAGDDHRFHSIEEELVILVFFAPAEYTNAPADAGRA